MIRFIFTTAFLLPCVFLQAQVTVFTLEDCQQKAKNNYPLIKQYDLISLSGKYNLENISKIYLPQGRGYIFKSALEAYLNDV